MNPNPTLLIFYGLVVVGLVIGVVMFLSKKEVDEFKRKETFKTNMIKQQANEYFKEMNNNYNNTLTTLAEFPGRNEDMPNQRVSTEKYMAFPMSSDPNLVDVGISVGLAHKLRAQNATGRLGLTELPIPVGKMWGKEHPLSIDVLETFKPNRGNR